MINFINKNRRIITIIFVLIVATLLISLIWRLADREPVTQVNNELVEVANLPTEYWLRKIDIEKTAQDTQVAKNDFDGYQITVPADWHIEDTASPDSGLQIVFQVGEIEVVQAHFEEGGLVLKIFAFDNPKQFDLINWLRHSQDARERGILDTQFERMNIGSHTAYVNSGPLTEEVFSAQRGIEYIEIEDTLVVQYLLGGGKNKIFLISCVALNDVDVLIPLCEKQVQTFTILNDDPLSEFFPYGGDGFEIDFNDADSNAGDSTYRVVLKPTLGLGADGFEKEIDAIVERVNNWIITKEVNPKNLSIEWVME